MRFALILPLALLVSVAVFLFMQSLIKAAPGEELTVPVYDSVEIFTQPPPDEREEPEPETVDAPADRVEPALEALSMQPTAPVPGPVPEVPAPELMLADLPLPATGATWSAPMIGAGDVNLSGQGVDPRGFVEVVPFNTRKPNVPELAWKNQVSGWVLVAFNVSADGNTRNIRVLDASPRGVFEEKVTAAVNDWRYSVHSKGPIDGDVVVTQKVEVRWQDYPRNLPNVD